MKKIVLITGGKGMVGNQTTFGIKLGRRDLDILDPKSIEKAIMRHQPKVILHLAAMTNMLACENNPKEAHEINVIGTKNIAKACLDHEIKLVYFSTCAVFNGKKKYPYKRNDSPFPINVYGETKWIGELEAQKNLPNSLIIRTGWLFGGGPKIDKKFVNITFQKMKEGLEVKATADRFGSPTYIADLLKTIKKLINKNAGGIFHVVNSGTASYFEIAKEIKKIGNFNSPVIPVKAFKVENPKVKRGKMEALASSKIKLRNWKEALKEYIETVLF